MSSTIASSILRSTSICAFISAGLSAASATKSRVIGRSRFSREMPPTRCATARPKRASIFSRPCSS